MFERLNQYGLLLYDHTFLFIKLTLGYGLSNVHNLESFNFNLSSLLAKHSLDCCGDIVRLGGCSCLGCLSVRHGSVHSADSDDWSVKVVECWAFSNGGADFRTNTMLRPSTFHCDAVVGFLDTLVDSVHVQRPDGPQVNHLTVDAFLDQFSSCVQSKSHTDRVSN